MADLDVTFADDIPSIQREGGSRKSKYRPLVDACVERPGKAARLVVDSQGQASSRASSIRTAAENHPNTKSGEGHFEVATRSGQNDDGDTEFYVYVKYNEGPAEESSDEETPAPKPKAKKAAKKVARKAG